MRIEINTHGRPVKDPDVRALYQIAHAIDSSTKRMKIANIAYFVDKLGYKLVKKERRIQ